MSWDGSTIGRFRVDGVIGRGGMGVVLRAYDPHLARPVAIKLLTEGAPSVANGTTVNLRESVDHDGLLDEARALAQIADQNVLAVHEIGSDAGRSFLVMELVEGEDVQQWLAAAPRSLPEILGVFAQAGRGLAAAHRRNVIHRDFKPENVLISPDGRVRVCDFGIAAFAQSRELIRAGRVGTPRYMAPELWGDRPASIASDVYAFAVSLVDAICGEVPGDPPLADQALAKRGVDARVRAVLVRALDADPAGRPGSIDEIVRTFAHPPRDRRWIVVAAAALAVSGALGIVIALRDKAGAACEDSRALLEARWSTRDREAVRAAVTAAGGAADADAIIGRVDRHAAAWIALRDETCALDSPHRAAQLSCLDRRLFELASVSRSLQHAPSLELAHGRSNSLVDLGACIEATVVRLPADRATRDKIEDLTARMVTVWDTGLAQLGSEGDQAVLERGRADALALGDPELAIRIDRMRAQLLGNGGKPAEAERVLDGAYTLASLHHADATASIVLLEASRFAAFRGDAGAARTKLEVARAHLERSKDATPYTRMMLYRAVARDAAARGAYADAHAAIASAVAAIAAMEPQDPLWRAQLDLERVWFLVNEGKLAGARELARTTETALRALGRQGVPDLGELLSAIARIEKEQGHRAQELRTRRDRVALLDRNMPAQDTGRVTAQAELGLALLESGELEEARSVLTETIARASKIPAMAGRLEDFHNYLSRAERALGNYEGARVHLDHALAAVRARTAPNDPEIGYHEITFAILELEAGDLERAATHLRIAEDALGSLAADHVNRLDLADVQIALALARDRPAEAATIATRTLALLAERKIDDARVERFWLGAAAARNARGDHAGARELATRVVERRRARAADPLELAVAEVEEAKARYALGETAALAELRALVKQLDQPASRFEHGQLLRWFRGRRLRP